MSSENPDPPKESSLTEVSDKSSVSARTYSSAVTESSRIAKLAMRARLRDPSIKPSAKVEEILDRFRAKVSERAALAPDILHTDRDKIPFMSIDDSHGTIFINGLERFGDDARMQVFLQLATECGLSISEIGCEAAVGKITTCVESISEHFYGFYSELQKSTPIVSMKVGGKKQSEYARGATAARQKISQHMFGKNSALSPYLNPLRKSEGAKTGYGLILSEIASWFTDPTIAAQARYAWDLLIKLYFFLNEERMHARIRIADHAKSFNQLYNQACRTKRTVVQQGGKKNKKAVTTSIVLTAATPTKPWEYPGVRQVEKPAVREAYSGPWDKLRELESRYNKVDWDKPTVKDDLDQIMVEIIHNVKAQWAARDAIHKATATRRSYSLKPKFGDQCAWVKETLAKFPELNTNVYHKDWDLLHVIPEKLERISADGRKIIFHRSDFNSLKRIDEVSPVFPQIASALREYIRGLKEALPKGASSNT